MMKHAFVLTAFALPALFFTAQPGHAAPPPAQCINKHCAIVAPAPAPAAPPILAAKGLGPALIIHPAVGIYCVEASIKPVAPFVPVVSVADDLSVPPAGSGISPGDGLVEINIAGKACPPPTATGLPFLQVDTYFILPGAPIPVVVPSDGVGFLIEF